jgi:hypothetical protein
VCGVWFSKELEKAKGRRTDDRGAKPNRAGYCFFVVN